MSLHTTTTIKHSTLNATLHGVLRRGGADVLQFRGIKYGHVPARFAAPIAVDDWAGANVDCKEYGPRCPQQAFDVGYLLRLPEDVELPREREDEFECLNLDISMPASEARVEERKREGLLPVMVWIHGECGLRNFLISLKCAGVPGDIEGSGLKRVISGGSQVMTFGSAASGICGECIELC